MTPAEVHAAIVARVQERFALARAAIYDNTSGRWWVVPEQPDIGLHEAIASEGVRLATGASKALAHIAANDPAFILRACSAALNRLERHRPDETGDCSSCYTTRVDDYGRMIAEYVCWPCPDVRDEAAVWGVEVDGDG